jgi:serine protease inhibitor
MIFLSSLSYFIWVCARVRALGESKADHPFILVIRDSGTGLMLFKGRVIGPS